MKKEKKETAKKQDCGCVLFFDEAGDFVGEDRCPRHEFLFSCPDEGGYDLSW